MGEPSSGSVKIRMYGHGLGDCLLVRLPKKSGETFNILIDCGLIGVASEPRPIMQSVVADIAQTCEGRLDLVVVTHEHWDHVSGFSCEQAQSAFDKMAVKEAWYAWTEDPKSKLGRRLREERAAKLRALNAAVVAVRETNTQLAALRGERLGRMLEFFGGEEPAGSKLSAAAVGRTRKAFEYLARRPGVRRRYCSPADKPIEFADVPGIRVYVLGPPQDEGLIKHSAPTKRGQEVYDFSTDQVSADNLMAAFMRLQPKPPGMQADTWDCPFDMTVARVAAPGKMPEKASAALEQLFEKCWVPDDRRRIDQDWTQAAESLALNLDSHTNNTSLVLAFELIDSGKVLLFAADAQVGNWLSWQDTQWVLGAGGTAHRVTGPDLLKRVVFYKVGHHGSHNATLRALGLEQMESEELVAFIPVCEEQARKNRWYAMPFVPLMHRLREKTRGRFVLSDKPDAVLEDLVSLSPAERADFVNRLHIDPKGKLYSEYSVDL